MLEWLALRSFGAALAGILATAHGEPSLFDFAQYGVLGLVIVGMIFGKIVPGWVVDRQERELERLRADLAAVRKNLDEQIIPALVRSTDILTRLADDERGPR